MPFQSRNTLDILSRRFTPGPPTGLLEGFSAGLDLMRASEQTISRLRAERDAYGAYIDRLEFETGTRLENPIADPEDGGLGIRAQQYTGGGETLTNASRDERKRLFLEEAAKIDPHGPRTQQGLEQDTYRLIAERAGIAEEELARTTTIGEIGSFFGQAFGALEDPPVMATMLLGAPAGLGILRTAAIEAGISGATEAAVQPFVQETRRLAGLPHGPMQALANIAAATVGAGVFTALLQGTFRSIGKGITTLREAREARTTRDQSGRIVLESAQDGLSSNPFQTLRHAEADHVERLTAAERRLRGEDVRLAPEPRGSLSAKARTPKLHTSDLPAEDRLQEAFQAGQDVTQAILDDAQDVQQARIRQDVARFYASREDLEGLIEAAKALPPDPRVKRLTQFLKEAGGLRDQGGELRALGITARARPGLVNNTRGLTLDQAGELAADAGYFRERPSVPDLLDALNDDFRGLREVVAEADQGRFDEFMAARQGAEALARDLEAAGTSLRRPTAEIVSTLRTVAAREIPAAERRVASEADLLQEELLRFEAREPEFDAMLEAEVQRRFVGQMDREFLVGNDEEGFTTMKVGDLLDDLAEDQRFLDEWIDCTVRVA